MDDEQDSERYWGQLPKYSDDFGEQVTTRWMKHQEMVRDSGKADQIDRSVMQYHSCDEFGNDTSRVTYSGDKGEIVQANVNEYRTLIRTKKAIALADDIRFLAQVLNDDSEAIHAQQAAQGILRHYDARGLFTQGREQLVETALVMSAGWIGAFWNRAAGQLEDVIDTSEAEDNEMPAEEPEMGESEEEERSDDQEPEDAFDWEQGEQDEQTEDDDEDGDGQESVVYRFSGDIEIAVYNALQVAWDTNSKDIADPNWMIVRQRWNRHELAALLPLERDEIMEAPCDADHPYDRARKYFPEDPDYIYPFLCFFKPSPLVPYGRTAIVLPGGHVVEDLPAKLHRVPLFPLTSSVELLGNRLPYGDEFDAILPCELVQDAITALSSQVDAKTPILDIPEGAKATQMGMFKVFKNPSDRAVQSVELFRPDESLYRNISTYQGLAARVAQINPAMMGNPSKYESGSSQAYQVSQGMMQMKQFTTALSDVMSRLATMVIELLRLHVDDGRALAIVGSRGEGGTVEFKRSRMSLVQNVTVMQVDPALDSHEGRKQFADMAAEKGWAKTKDEWTTAYVTGATGLLTGDDVARTALIKQENEQIRAVVRSLPPGVHQQVNEMIRGSGGQDVSAQVSALLQAHIDPMALPQVCVSDIHRDHYHGHADMEADELVRKDPLTKHLLQAHQTQHVLHLTPGSPVFNYQALMISGQQPLAIADPGTGAPKAPAEGQPHGAQGLEKPQGSAPKAPGVGGAGAAQAGLPPSMPGAPTSPGSGQPAPAQALAAAPVPAGARG